MNTTSIYCIAYGLIIYIGMLIIYTIVEPTQASITGFLIVGVILFILGIVYHLIYELTQQIADHIEDLEDQIDELKKEIKRSHKR